MAFLEQEPYVMDDGPVALTGAHGELTRYAGSGWEPLVRGQRVTITHGPAFSGEYRVTDVVPHEDGGETCTLEPASAVDARDCT